MVPISWTTPRTWVAGEVVTAAIGNAQWRDNLNFVYRLTGTVRGSDAVILSGTGFTAVRNGTGSYTVTFSSAFTNTPVVVACQEASTANFLAAAITAVSTSAFTCQLGTGSTNTDTTWSFVAEAV